MTRAEKEQKHERLTALMRRCRKIKVFEVEGTYYEGNFFAACENLINENPIIDSADFSVWLDNNYPILIRPSFSK